LLDYPLAWTLALPREAAILVTALLTSLVLTLVRKFTTNQDRMRRCKADLARLKTLLRQHKAAGDRAAVERTRATSTAVRLIQMRAEGLGLVVSLLPIGMLALWAMERLDYLPARVGQEVTITARYSLSVVDSVTHLVPPDKARLVSPAVQLVRPDPEDKEHGVATWALVSDAPTDGLEVLIRHDRQTAAHVLRVGGNTYDPPLVHHQGGAVVETEIGLTQAWLARISPMAGGLPHPRNSPYAADKIHSGRFLTKARWRGEATCTEFR
jgi:hypothetical protein